MTEKQACEKWVSEFNAIPQALVVRAFRESPDDLLLLAGGEERSDCCDGSVVAKMPATKVKLRKERNEVGECAYCCDPVPAPSEPLDEDEEALDRELTASDEDGAESFGTFRYCGLSCFDLDEEESREGDGWCEDCGERCDSRWDPPNDWPAMWGTHWCPNGWDQDWFRDNAKAVAACGFVVYESDETGILLGIDGAGYDFYEAHWLPLYRLRGLKWHDTEAEAEKKEAHA